MPSSVMTRGCPYCINDRVIPSATSTESLWHKTLPIRSFTEANFYAKTGAKAKLTSFQYSSLILNELTKSLYNYITFIYGLSCH